MVQHMETYLVACNNWILHKKFYLFLKKYGDIISESKVLYVSLMKHTNMLFKYYVLLISYLVNYQLLRDICLSFTMIMA